MLIEFFKNKLEREKHLKYSNIIENRVCDDNIDKEALIKENQYNLEMSKKYNNRYILIDDKYEVNLIL